jgi:hypothetical protein
VLRTAATPRGPPADAMPAGAALATALVRVMRRRAVSAPAAPRGPPWGCVPFCAVRRAAAGSRRVLRRVLRVGRRALGVRVRGARMRCALESSLEGDARGVESVRVEEERAMHRSIHFFSVLINQIPSGLNCPLLFNSKN